MTAGAAAPPPDLPVALPGDEDGPVFEEAWQAEAVALTVGLVGAGVFTWADWTAALSAAIAAAQAAGDPDLGDTYYEHWVTALEALCGRTGVAVDAEVDRHADAWRAAYLRTPHGRPVVLDPHDVEVGTRGSFRPPDAHG
ncbi:MAG: nitrile hydratase accessory protein [Actinobacteria bacterium]|nr:nitrile hydratase accessory protein [Actinomycetota bacterium]